MIESHEDPGLRAALKAHAEYYGAPDDLRRSILADTVRRLDRRNRFARWLHAMLGASAVRLGAAFAAGAIVAAIGATFFGARDESRATLVALISDHARSIVTDSPVEVRSSNLHTVKPWLSGKLGYSPAVVDLTDAGFPLVGGRRGFLGSEAVAVMVYAYKEHEIDVYALRATAYRRLPKDLQTIDGFNVVGWTVDDIRYLAVSDAEAERLHAFQRLLESRQREARGK